MKTPDDDHDGGRAVSDDTLERSKKLGEYLEGKRHGSSPRETRGTYTYKTGDWTYEELTEHRRKLLDEKALVWGALGFDRTHMTTAQIVADRATTLRGPFGWAKVLWRRATEIWR